MRFVKNVLDLAEAKELENAKATIVMQQATIDYIAMMTDVELPTKEVEQYVRED